MYIKIIGEDTKYNVDIEPFATQHGKNAMRFIGDVIPTTNNGFKFYDDEDNEIADFSDYKYEYRQNEYSTEPDTQTLPVWTDDPIPASSIDRRLASMSRQISNITPYEQTKKAYYGETEKVFYGVPQGNVSVFFDNYDGEYEISRIENRLIVSFPERLTDITNITITVQ